MKAQIGVAAARAAQISHRVAAGMAGALRRGLGEVQWTPPPWLQRCCAVTRRLRSTLNGNPRRNGLIAASVLVLGIAAIGAWRWYQSLPKPVEYAVAVANIERTCYECDPPGKPNAAILHFSGSVAPLSDAGKTIDPDKAGFGMRPAFAGEWRWQDDRTLVFAPKADWPLGQVYTVTFERRGFTAPQARLASYSAQFSSPVFGVALESNEFYQDPTAAADKKVVSTLKFTQPVDPATLERRISLKLYSKINDEREQEQLPAPAYAVTYDKLKLHAYVQTAQLAVLPKGGRIELRVDAGVRAARGSNETQQALADSVAVPGLYSLKVQELRLTVARNERDEPSQALVVETSHSVTEAQMSSRVRAWVLPDKHPDVRLQAAWEKLRTKRPYFWSAIAVTPAVLAAAAPLPLAYVANERDHVELHSFAVKTEPGRQVYVQVDKGLRSFGGYLMADAAAQVLSVPEYPKEVRIAYQGALLALSGSHKLTLFSRDVAALRVQVGRLLPDQLQHLVTQSGGDFAHPSFNNYEFNDANVTERYTDVMVLPTLPAGTANYQTLDLSNYLVKPGANRQGIFVLNIQAYDPVHKQQVEARDGDGSVSDTRLIVVTDLGLLAKKSVDGSQDVFVQSLTSGDAAAGVSVEIVARNGVSVLHETTDATGHVHFADLRGFRDEREPVLYLAKRGTDSAFLPIKSHLETLDLSRFDVGGISNRAEHAALSAFLFSDRGIYRPGDEIRAAAIVKTQDWRRLPDGLPLRVQIIDPRGIAIKRELIHLSAAGFEEIRYQTRQGAAVGNYTVNVLLIKSEDREELIGSMAVKVQEFLPDRLKLSTHFSSELAEGWVNPEKLQAAITLENLFGTAAANRRVQATMRLTPALPSFARYRDYQFRDPQFAKDGFTENLSDQRTSAEGKALFDLNLARFARATYRVSLVTQGYEADGGRGVTAEAAQLVSNLPFLVGWKADGRLDFVARGTARSVELLAIDQKLARVNAPGLIVKRIERRYVSVLLKQDSGVYKYESKLKEVALDERALELPATSAQLALDTTTPGNFSYQVVDAAGQVYARIDYSVAGAANLSRSLEKNAELQIVLDRHDYAPGDTISMQIQAPYVGAGLITIERDHVYSWQWFRTTTTSSVQKIRVPEGLEGNGYVSVSFVRDPASPEIYTTPLSYGVQPFSISLDARRNTVQLHAAALVKPGHKLTISYRTAQSSRIALFAVDEGILQVARYKTPDPLAHFFQKRSLDVSTRQVLDLILPEFRAAMLAAPGGDQGGLLGANLNPFKRKSDRPVAWWSGIVNAGSQQHQLEWTVPDYFNGRLRIIAVAVNDATIGIAEQSTLVRADFVLSPNAPLNASPGDEFEVSVGVANNVVGSGREALVSVSVEPSAQFAIVGPAQLALNIPELGEGVARFRVRTRDEPGSGTLRFSASQGARSAQLAATVSVRPAVAYMSSLLAGSFKGKTRVAVTRSLYPQYRTLQASLSTLPLTLAHGLSAYLARYPYSCTEQLVSQAMPAIVLAHRPEFGALKGKDDATLASVLDELRARQTGDGSFRYWAGGVESIDFVSVYALHVLLEASERGNAVPADLLESGKAFLMRMARRDGDSLAEERTSAYAIYLLARQGRVVANEAAAVQKRLETRYAKLWPQDIVAAYLAAAYQLMKQDRLAERAIGGVAFGAPADVDRWHAPMASDAMLLYLLARHFPERLSRLPDSMLDRIVLRVQNGDYDSLSAATTVLALDAYASAAATGGAVKFSATANLGDQSRQLLALPEGLFSKADVPATARTLDFTSDSALRSYYLINQSGFDRVPPTQAISKGLEITREFLSAEGKSVSKVKIGDEVIVHIRFRTLDHVTLDDAVLVDMLPGGFDLVIPNAAPEVQPLRRSSGEAESEGEGAGEGAVEMDGEEGGEQAGCACLFLLTRPRGFPDFADLREDRVVLYGSASDQVQEFSYRIKATNAGAFIVPAAYGESMYHPQVKARSVSAHMVVERQ
jgi:alpha-2-macroglobulin